MEKSYKYNRSSSYTNRYFSKHHKPFNLLKRFDKKLVGKMMNQFIISLVAALLIIIMSNIKVPFMEKVIESAKWVAGSDYDFMGAINSIVPGITEKLGDIPGAVNDMFNGSETVDAMSNSIDSVMILPAEGKTIQSSETDSNFQGTSGSGIDILCAEGTPIKAALGGIVEKVEDSSQQGRVIRIKHNNGMETVYSHCSEILVDENQTVAQGDYIAKAGHTGTVSETVLHFEVFRDGKSIDPLGVLGGTVEAR